MVHVRLPPSFPVWAQGSAPRGSLTRPPASSAHVLLLWSPGLFCFGCVFVVLDLRKKALFLLSVFGGKVKVCAHVCPEVAGEVSSWSSCPDGRPASA